LEEEILKVEGLQTRYFTDDGVLRVVDSIDFCLKREETLGIVGESGCGKTVTALSIMRLLPENIGRITAGRILFDGIDLVGLTEEEMEKIRGNRISMIFQEPMTSLNPVMRVGDQISESLLFHKNISRDEAHEKVVELLKLVEIPSPERRYRDYPHQLSGGMRQRVMIAMALSCSPQILIADEPTTALDVTIQAQILELLSQLKTEQRLSILLITHNLGVVAENARRVIVMYAGKIVEEAEVKEIFSNPLHPYTLGLMKSLPETDRGYLKIEKLEPIRGMVPDLWNLPEGCRFQPRCDLSSSRCHQEEPPLKEIHPNHRVRCWRQGE
jgi:oligopeptide/dipeptide ABC transporter ATP-binding protein